MPLRRCCAFAVLLALMLGALASAQEAAVSDATAPGTVTAAVAEVGEEAAEKATGWMMAVDAWFKTYLVTPVAAVLYYDFGTEKSLGTAIPFIIAWLFLGSVYLTLRMGFINVRAFWHAINVTRGKYDDEDDEGEVTHFQALTAALSATLGLGNITGVAIAVGLGGPGAIFWLIVAGLFGMSSKFVECTLGQMYRRVDEEHQVSGGPMRYLSDGFEDIGLKWLGKPLAILFAVLCIGGSIGGGTSFQVSQSLDIVKTQIPWFDDGNEWVYGVIMAALVGIVIIGGIRRIAATAEKIVPLMCVIYVVACLTVLVMNASAVPAAIQSIFSEAFRWESAYGGFWGVMVMGIKRAAFSNEAGIGSAAIAHSAAKTEYPVREGIVSLLEPFIDTVVICTMTGLVIVVTGAYDVQRFPEHAQLITDKLGSALTSKAFESQISWFPYVLTVSVLLFAYATIISWSYYGERCATYLFGQAASLPYKVLVLVFIVLGSIVKATNIVEFSDLMIFSMALPNMLALVLLSKKVKLKLDDYWQAYKMGDFEADRT